MVCMNCCSSSICLNSAVREAQACLFLRLLTLDPSLQGLVIKTWRMSCGGDSRSTTLAMQLWELELWSQNPCKAGCGSMCLLFLSCDQRQENSQKCMSQLHCYSQGWPRKRHCLKQDKRWGCSLTLTHAPWHVCVHIHTNMLKSEGQ